MTIIEARKNLKCAYPLMDCANLIEFKQRLQWLSEGMLKNHLLSIINYSIDYNEIELYNQFKINCKSDSYGE